MNRLNLVCGKDVIKRTWRVTNRLWVACHLAQEIRPTTGEPWLYKDPNSIEKIETAWPADALLSEVTRTITPITPEADKVTAFLGKAESKMVDEGLRNWTILRTDITSDLLTASIAKAALLSDKNLTADKTKLSTLGEQRLITSWMIDKVNIKTVEYDESSFHANCSHSVIDGLRWIFKGRESSTGEPISYSDTDLRTIITERMRAARIEAQISGHVDAPMLLSIITWIEAHKMDDPIIMAAYIDANLPLYPIVRRHWAL